MSVKSTFPWMRFYAEETLSDQNFAAWNASQRGIWFTLILYCWKEGRIPADPAKLARITATDAKSFKRLWLGVADRFTPDPDDKNSLISLRLEFERDERIRESEEKHKSAVNAAVTRWDNYRKKHADAMRAQCDSNADAMPEQCDSNADAMPEQCDSNADAMRGDATETETLPPKGGDAPCVAPSLPADLPADVPKEKKPRKPRKESQYMSLKEILGDEKTQKRYWGLVACWPRRKDWQKNPAPKSTALYWLSLIERGIDPKAIYTGALRYQAAHCELDENGEVAKDASGKQAWKPEAKFMKSVLTWLQEEGWTAELMEGEQ